VISGDATFGARTLQSACGAARSSATLDARSTPAGRPRITITTCPPAISP
jgi:hypothetical protein